MHTNQLKGVLIMLITVLIRGGMFPVAKGATVAAVAWELAYLTVLAVVLAVLFWNMAIGYLGAFPAR